MSDRQDECYRAWTKEKPPSPWVEPSLTVASIGVLLAMVVSALRNV